MNKFILIADEDVIYQSKDWKKIRDRFDLFIRTERKFVFHLTLLSVKGNKIEIKRKEWKRQDQINLFQAIKLMVRDVILGNSLKEGIAQTQWLINKDGKEAIINKICYFPSQLVNWLKEQGICAKIIKPVAYTYIPARYREELKAGRLMIGRVEKLSDSFKISESF